MGSHGKNACVKCGNKEDLTWISWFKLKHGKGGWFCPKHDAEEAQRYLRETE